MKVAAFIFAIVAGLTVVFAAPASAGEGEQRYVKVVTQDAFNDMDYEGQEFVCMWFNYDRKDMYKRMWRELWVHEGVTYNDMRVGVYRALRPIC